MRKSALTIAGITVAAVVAAASALAQSPGAGDSGTSPMERRGPRGMGMQNMARGMGPCMDPDMMQRMGSGMMQHMGPRMMQESRTPSGSDLGEIGPAQLATLKTELGITPAQETAWTKYSNALSDAAATMKSTRETAKTAADELLAALDEAQKAKAREVLPGLATSGPGMMGSMPMGDHR